MLCVSLASLVGAAAMVTAFTFVEGDPEYGSFALFGGVAAFMVSSVFCTIVGVPFRKVTNAEFGRT
jgi:hypothetical protein